MNVQLARTTVTPTPCVLIRLLVLPAPATPAFTVTQYLEYSDLRNSGDGTSCTDFRQEHVMQMSYNIWAVPRQSFCWLNETKVIVVSFDYNYVNGHCELVDTVSKIY